MTQTLPLSKDISPKATLEELKLTKAQWLDMARANGYPDIMWEIVRWLGEMSPSPRVGEGDVRLWKHGANIAIIGKEVATRFLIGDGVWQRRRSFHVFVRTTGEKYASKHTPNEIAEIAMSSEVVMKWSWKMTYNDDYSERTKVEGENVSFINGEWVLAVREFIGKAQVAKEKYNATNTDVERVGMLKELFAGVSL